MAKCIDCNKSKKNKKNKRCYSCAQKERFTRMSIHNKGKKRWWDSPTQWVKNDPRISGENAYQWKIEGFTMTALHSWVKKQLGKPLRCDFCETTTAKKFEWANKSQLYIRDASDWLRLCTSCHKIYDFVCRKFLKYNFLLMKGGKDFGRQQLPL